MSSQDVNNEPTGAADACEACPLGGIVERRAFLRDATLAVAGIFVALGAATSDARALPVRMASALSYRGDERTYPVPIADGATIDKDESLIVARNSNVRSITRSTGPTGPSSRAERRAVWIASPFVAITTRSWSISTSSISRTKIQSSGRLPSSKFERGPNVV